MTHEDRRIRVFVFDRRARVVRYFGCWYRLDDAIEAARALRFALDLPAFLGEADA